MPSRGRNRGNEGWAFNNGRILRANGCCTPLKEGDVFLGCTSSRWYTVVSIPDKPWAKAVRRHDGTLVKAEVVRAGFLQMSDADKAKRVREADLYEIKQLKKLKEQQYVKND